MNYKTNIILIIFVICFGLFGCEDQNTITNEYNLDTSSSVVGRFITDQPSISVYLWQAELEATTQTDSAGYFEFLNISPGVYELRASDGTVEHIRQNIEVKKSETTSLGEINFNSLSWPFVSISPGNNEESVDIRNHSILIITEEYLDLQSMNSSIVFEPVLTGFWEGSQTSTPPYHYVYHTEQSAIIDTTYTITILPSLVVYNKGAWNDSLSISFRTSSFKAISKQLRYPLNSVPPMVNNVFLTYYYNLPIDRTSAENSVTISPSVSLIVNVAPSYNNINDILTVDFLESLTPEETYTIVIASTFASANGFTTGVEDSIVFTVQPITVVNYGFSYSYGSYSKYIEPGLPFDFEILLNAEVDMNAFNTATTITPNIPGLWYSLGNGRIVFAPTTSQELAPEQTYTISIDSSFPLIAGKSFKEDLELQCFVNPVRVSRIRPTNGDTYSYSTTNIYIDFNTPMNRTVTQNAITLKTIDGTPLSGIFSWNDDYRVVFNPTANLEIGKYYQIDVSTVAENLNGYKLKTAEKSIFKIRN